VVRSPALSDEQRRILEQRGVLSPDELHRLASKTRRAMDPGATQKADCHSDYVSPKQAEAMQRERLVQLRRSPAAE